MYITIWELILFVNVCLSLNPALNFQGFQRLQAVERDYLFLQSFQGISIRASPEVNIGIGGDYVARQFDIKDEEIVKVLDGHIKANVKEFCHLMQFAPVSFLPSQDSCCGKKMKLSKIGRSVKVFCKEKTYHSRSYVSTCGNCKAKYGYGYKEIYMNSEIRRSYYARGRFFLLTQESIFEEALLREFTDVIVLSRSHFNQLADIYNREKKTEDKLDSDILSNTLIVWNLLRRLPGYGCLISRRSESNRHIDVETLCQEVIPDLQKTFDVWKHHKCKEIGCSARVAIVDGNNKNKRKICMAKGEKIIPTDKSQWNTYKKCINNPVRKESKFCEKHMHEGQAETLEQQDLRPNTRKWTKEMEERGLLPELDDDMHLTDPEGCRKKENITKETSSTAGILLWCRPCLLRLHLSEIYHAESLSQWTVSMIDTFGMEPLIEFIQYVCGDRACEFEPFLKKRATAGNVVLQKYMAILEDKMVIDKFHGDRHTKEQCKPQGDLAKFNARLPKFADIDGTNYEAAEQSFIKINQMSGTTNYMTYGRRLCLMIIVNDEFNACLEDEKEKKKELLISGRQRQEWRQVDDAIRKKNDDWKYNLPGLFEE